MQQPWLTSSKPGSKPLLPANSLLLQLGLIRSRDIAVLFTGPHSLGLVKAVRHDRAQVMTWPVLQPGQHVQAELEPGAGVPLREATGAHQVAAGSPRGDAGGRCYCQT